MFFKERTETAVAYVTKVRENGIYIIIPKYGIEELVRFDTKVSDSSFGWSPFILPLILFPKDSESSSSSMKEEKYEVFDRIFVRISVTKHQSAAGNVAGIAI
jgi:hypothetical protein